MVKGHGRKVVVTGAGGFVGSWLVSQLAERRRNHVIGVDIHYPQFCQTNADEFKVLDLRDLEQAMRALDGADEVYALAADMGGAGFVFTGKHDAEIIWNNSAINLNTIKAADIHGVKRVLFTSSACVYNWQKQTDGARPLQESDAYPAMPDSVYGWEKLFSEIAYGTCLEDARIARLHNVYGPMGTWAGQWRPNVRDWAPGREKVPAAMCRKVARAKLTGDRRVEVWGDGEQRRSFCYVADCVDALERLMASDLDKPVNIGTEHAVSVNELLTIIEAIAGFQVERVHVPGPEGVRDRNADLHLARSELGWEPTWTLADGLAETYRWVEAQVSEELG